MNTKAIFVIAAFAALAGTAARADDITIDTTPFQATLTRAEVQANLAQYKQVGVNPWSISYNQLAGFQSARSRADVQAEYIADRDQVAAMTAEDSGSAFLAQAPVRNHLATLAGTPVNGQ
ncbi:MAG: DUF4148 domain-containing protein [Ramlibacter sp.]